MDNLPVPLRHCLIFFMLAVLPACSPLSESTFVLPWENQEKIEVTEPSDPETFQHSSVEPEESLLEELIGLDQTGSWVDSDIATQPALEEEVVHDFPITINKQVQFYLDLFQGRQRSYFERWMARSTKYLPTIHAELQQAGLPLDLAYLAMIESGFNPSAYSRAHASGLWQFIRGTGRNYGLRIDSWVDERRNPEKATKAAIAYLSFLHSEFDDWYLAVAAYNAGEGKIGRAIKKYKTRDFWKLAEYKYLKLETKRYVPKLIAAILIAKQPEKYGFTAIKYQEPVESDHIDVPPGVDLAAVAVSAGTSVKKIRSLNNELKKSRTPPGSKGYTLAIPAGSKELVADNLNRLHPVITTDFKTHTVRKGDTLTKICRRYSLNKTTLLKANKLRSAQLKKGQRLRIPYRTTKYVLLKEGETAESRFADAGKGGKMILHELRKGDTLSKIAKQYKVPVEVLKQWNDITNERKIRAGQHLALYIDHSGKSVPVKVAQSAQPAVASRKEIPILRAGKKRAVASVGSEALTWYRVRSGDSLWTIARKFQVSTEEIRAWNNLNSNRIKPGVKLIVKSG